MKKEGGWVSSLALLRPLSAADLVCILYYRGKQAKLNKSGAGITI